MINTSRLLFLLTVLSFSVPGYAGKNTEIHVLPVEKTAKQSTLFSVSVKGQPLFTQTFKDIHYVHFEHNKSISIEIRSTQPVTSFEVAPKTKVHGAAKKGNSITLNIAGPGYYIVTVNHKERLFILTDNIQKDIAQNKEVVSVMQFAPDSTGAQVTTRALQEAIDKTAATGKILYFPAGIYKTGTLRVGSNANIFLAPGAMIKGSEKREDYPADDHKKESDHVNDKAHFTDNGEWMTFSRLILIDNATNVKIWGRGIIDGNGAVVRAQGKPANLIRIRHSKNVLLDGIELRDPACWNTHILYSDGVTIRNIKMLNDRDVANTDGFDPDASKNVLIENSFAYCSDDNVAIKTTNNGNLLQDIDGITVRNNVFLTKKSALKVGTETKGARMRNILFANNYVAEADRGLVLYCYDGALFEHIRFENNYFEKGLQTKNLKAIHFQIKERNGKGQIRNVLIKNCDFAASFSTAAEIVGLDPQHTIDGILFKNVRMGGTLLLSPKDLSATTNPFVKNIRFEK